MKNFDLVGILISALLTVGTEPAVAYLQAIHDKDVKLYLALVYAANYLLAQGTNAAAKTGTKIDDELAAALKTVLSASASANGITL